MPQYASAVSSDLSDQLPVFSQTTRGRRDRQSGLNPNSTRQNGRLAGVTPDMSASAADRVVLNLKVVIHGPRPEMRYRFKTIAANLSQKLGAFVPFDNNNNNKNNNSAIQLEMPRSVPADVRGPLLALLRENVALNVSLDMHTTLSTRDALCELCSLIRSGDAVERSSGPEGVNTALLLVSDYEMGEQSEMALRHFLRLTSEAIGVPILTALYDNVALNAVRFC